jgi:hypothetical protein
MILGILAIIFLGFAGVVLLMGFYMVIKLTPEMIRYFIEDLKETFSSK